MARAPLVLALLAACLSPAAVAEPGGDVLAQYPPTPGLCVLVGDGDATGAVALAGKTKLTFLVQTADADAMARACRQARAAGLLGRRIFVAQADRTIPLADNMADLVVVRRGARVPRKEILRALRPGGKGVVGSETFVKPTPKGLDDWSHHYHGPDNNPQSLDTVARAPFLTQFVVAPRYAPCPQAAVAAGGRVFMAFGHVAWHEREEPWLNTLIAVNGYNGAMLWRKPLPAGIMVDRSTMIATPDVLYLADGKSCKLLDPATGKVTGEIAAPPDLAGGTFWKWMALSDGVLYALVGGSEKPDDVAKWRRRNHGWPWSGISKGYNAGEYPWGFAHTLLAIDPKTRKVLWSHKEEIPIDSRSLCMKAGKIFFCHFGRYLACLNSTSGKPVWRKTADADAGLFEAIGPYRPGHGYVGGWKSTVYLKCTDKNVYFLGPQVHHLTAVSADDGRLLWRYPGKDLHIVIRPDAVYCTGPQNVPRGQAPDTRKLDPLTGKVLASYAVNRRACTRSTGSVDGIYFRAPGGSVRLDLATGKSQWISPMRPSCLVGVMIAQGHMYWVPWTCDCNLQMFGFIGCGPAGGFDFGAEASESERLETADGAPAVAAPAPAELDWPTYRGNNARTAEWGGKVPDKVRTLWHHKPAHSFAATAPVAAGGMVLLAGSDGVVRALDAADGKPKWQAYTGAGVRFPPALAGGRAFVGSGDGWAYAFDARTGKRLWRFRAAPQERRITVFGQLQSTWPVAAGVLVEGDTAYLAAGMNNFDGTHVYALDAASGRIKWQNNTSGHLDRFSRRGVAVQGDMLLHGGKLFLAGGNAASPGVFDPASGKCLTPAPTQPGSRAPRGRELRVQGRGVSVTGQPLYSAPNSPVYDGSVRWLPVIVQAKNARLHLRPNDTGRWALTAQDTKTNRPLWSQPLPAAPVRWGIALDAKGRIFVTLHDGQVLCFGA